MGIDPKVIGTLPARPGAYLFKDAAGAVLYVGKGKSLRARVRSYVSRPESLGAKNRRLMKSVDVVETVVVGTEAEALILEANLIKEHRPPFNILLRDDKSFPYIKVTVTEPFPRVLVTRRVTNDGSRYFGPYTSVGPMRAALKAIKGLNAVRSCRYRLPSEMPSRACLDHHIGRCRAPCVGLQSEDEYRAGINEVIDVLEGDTERVRSVLSGRMERAATRLDFEEAVRLRDAVAGLDGLADRQRVHRALGGDFDVFGVARDGDVGVGAVLRVRRGVLLGRSSQRLSRISDAGDTEMVSSLVHGYYFGRGLAGRTDLPRHVLVSCDLPDAGVVADILSESAGRAVSVSRPKRGERLALLGLAAENARESLEDRVSALAGGGDRAEKSLFALQEALDLKVVPRLMTCLDVSHTQGADTVAAAVVFKNGEPHRASYRRMRIKSDLGIDDVASMQEAVSRFLQHRLDGGERLPDVVVVDGGAGQLGAALKATNALEAPEMVVLALAKRNEEVHVPGQLDPLRLDRADRALHLLQRMRDEAHRVAHGYNRRLRSKHTLKSGLGDIPGIGPNRQRLLLTRFGSLRGVREATRREIARLPGFGETLASRVLTYLGR